MEHATSAPASAAAPVAVELGQLSAKQHPLTAGTLVQPGASELIQAIRSVHASDTAALSSYSLPRHTKLAIKLPAPAEERWGALFDATPLTLLATSPLQSPLPEGCGVVYEPAEPAVPTPSSTKRQFINPSYGQQLDAGADAVVLVRESGSGLRSRMNSASVTSQDSQESQERDDGLETEGQAQAAALVTGNNDSLPCLDVITVLSNPAFGKY